MPTYVYRRPDGTTFEVTQRISDDALTVDPETGEPVERVIGGGAGLIFKGTGFYVTDYVRKSGSADSSDVSPPKTKPSSEAKTDAKKETSTTASAPASTSSGSTSSGD